MKKRVIENGKREKQQAVESLATAVFVGTTDLKYPGKQATAPPLSRLSPTFSQPPYRTPTPSLSPSHSLPSPGRRDGEKLNEDMYHALLTAEVVNCLKKLVLEVGSARTAGQAAALHETHMHPLTHPRTLSPTHAPAHISSTHYLIHSTLSLTRLQSHFFHTFSYTSLPYLLSRPSRCVDPSSSWTRTGSSPSGRWRAPRSERSTSRSSWSIGSRRCRYRCCLMFCCCCWMPNPNHKPARRTRLG